MLQHKFEVPKASKSDAKSSQIDLLNDFRTSATEARERNLISHKAISQRVQAPIADRLLGLSEVATNHVGLDRGMMGYEAQFRNISPNILTDDNISTCSFDARLLNSIEPANTTVTHKYSWQAKRAIQKYEGDGMTGSFGNTPPEGDGRQLEIRNGEMP